MSATRRVRKTHGTTHHMAVVGALGAVHFHWTPTPIPGLNQPFYSGLETHYVTPPHYMRDEEASHDECWLLGAECWHDGTSLYASEVLIQRLLRDGEDALWAVLEREYRERFA